jgi:hypothetical protein
MNILFRNFFYAVGITVLAFMYGADPSTATFGDMVRMVQSHNAQQLVLAITAVLIGLEFVSGGTRKAGSSFGSLAGNSAEPTSAKANP